MRKITSKIIIIIILFLTFINNPKAAENYKLDSNGNYSVKEAYCTYTYNLEGFNEATSITREIKINIKDEEIYNVSYKDGSTNGLYLNSSVKYSQFFTKQYFSCPETVQIYYTTAQMPIGYYVTLNCSENSTIPCTSATLLPKESKITYNEKAEDDEPTDIKETDFSCSYVKETDNVGGTDAQVSSPGSLVYYQYKDNTNEFISGTGKKYAISTGKLDDCENLNIYLKINANKGDIVSYDILDNSCSDVSDGKCIIYRLEDKSSNTTLLADPSIIPTETYDLEMNVSMDFEVDGCESLLGSTLDANDPAYYLDFAFKLIKYLAIVLLFVLTIIDFAKAVASSKDDAIKKALQTAIKRLIIAIIIFFLPILINFILEILGIVSTDPLCNIG